MKTYSKYGWVMLGLGTVIPGYAENTGETQETYKDILLPNMVIEGEIIRPGTVGVSPNLGGVNDAATLMSRVPGANVNKNGPLSGIAQYRGLFGDRVNVISDGANYKPACSNAMDAPLSHVPASLTEELKVYRGIAPVSSGIETFGGTIIQETRKGDFASGDDILLQGRLSAGYNGVNNGYYGSIFANIANENNKFRLGGSYERGDDYRWGGGVNKPTQHRRGAYTVGYGFQSDDQDQSFDLGLNYNDTGKTGTPSLPMDIIYSKGYVPTATYESTLADKYDLKLSFQYENVSHRMDNFTLRGISKKTRQSDNTAKGFGYKAGLGIPLFDGTLTVGADGDNIEHNQTIIDPFNAKFRVKNFNDTIQDRYGFFGEWSGFFSDKLEFELGARLNWIHMNADTVSASGAKFNPAGQPVNAPAKLQNAFNNSDRRKDDVNVDVVAVLNYSIRSDMGLEIGFARKVRSPSYQERYLWLPLSATGGLADGRNYVGNIDLAPETSYQGEIGFDWQFDTFYLAPRAFYRYVDNYIQGTPTTNQAALKIDPNTLEFTNINAELYGVDLETGIRLWDDWRLTGLLSYVRGKRTDADDNLYRIAPLNGRVEFFYDVPEWLAGIEVIAYAKQDKVSSFNDEKPSAGYAFFNLRGQYRPQANALKGLQIGVGIENVLGKEYRTHLSGLNRSPVNEGTAIGEHLPGPGRNYYLTFSYDI